MAQEHDLREPITQEGLESLRAEIEELESAGRNRMAARLKAARELGDLKENADYHIAKEDQAHLETKIKRLRLKLQSAEVADVDDDSQVFAFGRTAEIADDAGRVHTWTLVGSTEAALPEGRLSVQSPIGQALRDRGVGERICVQTPGGERTFRIERLVD
jgi:transcription elongation factor GreA